MLKVIPGFSTISVLRTIVCPSKGIFPDQEIAARFPPAPSDEPVSVVPSSFILFIKAIKSGISLISRMVLLELYQLVSGLYVTASTLTFIDKVANGMSIVNTITHDNIAESTLFFIYSSYLNKQWFA